MKEEMKTCEDCGAQTLTCRECGGAMCPECDEIILNHCSSCAHNLASLEYDYP